MLIICILAALVIPPVLWFSFIGLKTFVQPSGAPPKPAVQHQASLKKSVTVDAVLKNDNDPIISDEETVTDKETQELRGQFKSNFSHYEIHIEPDLLQNQNWMPEKLFEINELKRRSLNFFSTGEYTQALKTFEQVHNMAVSVIKERTNAFEDQVNKAQNYFENDQEEQARFHIEKALQIKPDQQEALVLLHKIDKLAQIIPLLTEVEVARAENDFSKEYKLLGQIQRIAPEREGVAQRRAELESFLKEQAFAHHIDNGFEAVEAADLNLAVKHYTQAKAIAPHRQETALLKDRITTLERKLRVRTALRKADQAIHRDDWQTALYAYMSASKDAPRDQTIQKNLARATEIVALEKTFKSLLTDPYQLSDPAAKNRAEKLINQARPMEQYSFSLQLKNRELAEKLAIMQQPMAVTVISDKKTYVKVIGVGNVGHVIEKTIQLKPGRYTFEGRRNGYVSKRVETLIPYDKKALPVNVICDQPI